MPQDLSRLYLLQNISLMLFIAAALFGAFGAFLYLSAYGGISGLKGRLTHKKLLKQQALAMEDGSDEVVNDNSYEAPVAVLSRTEEMAGQKKEEEKEEIEETKPIETELDVDDPTGVLSTRKAEAPFRITKKITITHESEGKSL